ncbi:MAG: GIY-YIG nuclease family protein [Ardenticatenaceae bacterium]|nr:GIY-YIG nuclease family protein [Ardenticatenaceae bacterium]
MSNLMNGGDGLPVATGAYVVGIHLPHLRVIRVGKLGEIAFPPGEYLYVGSAFGPGGLRARLGRHLRGGGRPHWHIDALRAVAPVRGFWYTVTTELLECRWSQLLAGLPQATIPAPRFGASDCRAGCLAHLVALPAGADLSAVQAKLVTVAGASVVAVTSAGVVACGPCHVQ